MPRENFHRQIEAAAIAPAVYTTAQASGYIDLQGFDSALILVHSGAYTSGSGAITIEESSNGTSSDLATGLDGTTAAKGRDGRVMVLADTDGVTPKAPVVGAANTIVAIAYTGQARYIKVSVGAVSATYGALVIKGHPRYAPTRTSGQFAAS